LPEILRDDDDATLRAMREVETTTHAESPMQYTVQLGIFKSSAAPENVSKMNPIPPSKVREGAYRYTTMVFAEKRMADSVRATAVKSGIADAFVVGVQNGKYIAVSNAIPANVKSDNLQKWNDLVKEEVATKEPVYKVQIGAFRNDVPYHVVESFLLISDKGITRKKDERDLHIFYAGNFKDLASASGLREEINSKGIKDAFVVVLQDGKRISIPLQ
jgi:hypothetical protein